MKRPNILVRMIVILSVLFVLIAAAAGLMAYFFMERVVVVAVNSFTGYNVSYSEWQGHLLGKSQVKGLIFEVKNRGVKIKAQTAHLEINVRESLRKKALILDANLEKVEILGLMGKKSGIALPDNVLSIPFSPGHVYDSISFNLSAGEDVFTLAGFKALSDDSRISGDLTFSRARQEVDLDVKMSFSPKIVNMLPGDMRDRVLSPDADGWYSTIIDYKGTVIFLKALYSLTS